MGKLNFRIVEQRDNFPQSSFNQDYMDKSLSKRDIMAKYDMTEAQWTSKSRHARKETGYCRQKGYKANEDTKYIRRLKKGYRVQRSHRGFSYTYGTYPDLKTARMVRDLLEAKDWDEDYASELMKMYGTHRNKNYGNQYFSPVKEEALSKYKEFKKLYLGGEHSYQEILDELGLSKYQYTICRKQLKLDSHNPSLSKKMVYRK